MAILLSIRSSPVQTAASMILDSAHCWGRLTIQSTQASTNSLIQEPFPSQVEAFWDEDSRCVRVIYASSWGNGNKPTAQATTCGRASSPSLPKNQVVSYLTCLPFLSSMVSKSLD